KLSRCIGELLCDNVDHGAHDQKEVIEWSKNEFILLLARSATLLTACPFPGHALSIFWILLPL
ncbi:MAG: hypothetical protein KC505_01340, partial [Myxococcales bacterium]|nr:hypothetical protein [Myxococcales bacterium]